MIMADQQVVLKNPTGEIVARRKPKKVSLEEDEFTDVSYLSLYLHVSVTVFVCFRQ